MRPAAIPSAVRPQCRTAYSRASLRHHLVYAILCAVCLRHSVLSFRRVKPPPYTLIPTLPRVGPDRPRGPRERARSCTYVNKRQSDSATTAVFIVDVTRHARCSHRQNGSSTHLDPRASHVSGPSRRLSVRQQQRRRQRCWSDEHHSVSSKLRHLHVHADAGRSTERVPVQPRRHSLQRKRGLHPRAREQLRLHRSGIRSEQVEWSRMFCASVRRRS